MRTGKSRLVEIIKNVDNTIKDALQGNIDSTAVPPDIIKLRNILRNEYNERSPAFIQALNSLDQISLNDSSNRNLADVQRIVKSLENIISREYRDYD